jgi:hypothetical protein
MRIIKFCKPPSFVFAADFWVSWFGISSLESHIWRTCIVETNNREWIISLLDLLLAIILIDSVSVMNILSWIECSVRIYVFSIG